MFKRSCGVILVVMAAMALLVACGGGEEAPTKQEFIAEADAICKEGDEKQLAAMSKVQGQGQKALIQAGLGTVQEQAEELAALRPPSGDEEQVEEFIDEMEAAVRKTEQDPVKLIGTAFVGVDELASDYGFQDCGEVL